MSDPGKAVFLSYASQDAEAAKRIADALRAAGVEVWFDQSELIGGDAWDAKIRKQIKECALFIPIISANTQSRTEGYFRLEWRLADQRTHLMGRGRAFLLPVCIDETKDADADVPDSFSAVQWTRLKGGETSPAFAERVKKLLRGEQGAGSGEMGAGRSRPAAETYNQEPRTENRRLGRLWWALPMFGVAMALLLVMKESRKEPAPAVASATPVAPLSEARQLAERARALINKPGATRTELEAADELCTKAARLDPADAEVLATWSQVCSWFVFHGFDPDLERKDAANSRAAQALQLAPESYEARFAYAFYLTPGIGGRAASTDEETADTIQQALLRERPDEPRVLLALGMRQGRSGQVEAARATLGRLTNNPAYAAIGWGELGWGEMLAGNLAAAEAAVDRANDIQPLWRNLVLKALLALEWRGDLDLALATEKRMPPSVRQADVSVMGAYIHLVCRDPKRTLQIMEAVPREWLRTGGYEGPKAVWTALAHEQLHEKDRAEVQWQLALKLIERRVAERPDRSLHLLEAYVLAALDRPADAEKTLGLVPDAATYANMPWLARNRYLLTQLRLGHVDAALEYLEKDPRLTAAVLRIEPSLDPLRGLPRFQALLARLEADPSRSPTAKPVVAAPKADDKSIAVLPFANMSPDADNAFFCDGMHEDVITALAKIRDLKVISRTSVLAYRDPAARNLRKIAAELGVGAVLEGSVRRVNNKVRLTAQLIDARTDQHLWAETYDRDVTDVFAIQSALATEIAAALRTTLSAGERSLIERRPTENQEAYDLYLRARARILDSARLLDPNRTNMTLGEAVALYEQAVTKDPNFALAYAALSALHSQAYWDGTQDPTPARREKARVAAETAVRLAPDLPQARLALGIYYYRGLRDWPRALAEFRAAETGLPNDSTVIQYLAFVYRRLGRWTEAVDCFARAAVLNPGAPGAPSFQIGTELYLRRFAEANEAAGQASARFPHLRFGHHDRSRAQYEIDGDRAAYLRRLEALPREAGDPHGLRAAIELAVARGDYEAADQALADPRLPFIESEDAVIADPVTLYRAQLAFIRGQAEKARGFADEAIAYYRKGTWMPRQESWVLRGIAQANAFAGRTDEALRDARAALAAEEGHDALNALYLRSDLGRVYAVLGRREEALAVLRTLMTGPSSKTPQEIRHDPLWSRLKDDPRFEEILKSAKPL